MGSQLTIEPLGQTVDVEEGQTLLDASLRAGVYLPHACCHGLCGTCKVEVLEGDVEHGPASSFALMDYEREERMCLACCAVPLSDVTIEADVEVEPDALNLPVRDFTGVVSRVASLTPSIKGVFIELHDADGLRFQAGQYVTLRVPGVEEGRPFSLASSPSCPRALELDVRLVPGGKATTWIHQELEVGAEVRLSGPYGRFFVRKSVEDPLLFLAGGSGLSSPRSMIRDLLEEGCGLPITLIHGARTQDELLHHRELTELAQAHPSFRYLPVLSNEPPESLWAGARGLVHQVARAHFGNDFRGHQAYLCGPPAMIDACITTLMQGRLFERDIFTERFFSAADAQQVRSPLFKKI